MSAGRTYEFEVPEDSEAEPCPMGCGEFTDDAAGGPCSSCWDNQGDWPTDGCGSDW